MLRNWCLRGLVISLLMVSCGAAVSACGGSNGPSQAEVKEFQEEGEKRGEEKAKEQRLEREIQKLKRERQEEKKRIKKKKQQPPQPDHGADAEPSPAPAPSTPSGTDCGEGVIAGPETSCGFALETRNEYETYIGSGPGTVEAYSAANETWYSMTCTAAPHACSGAISATVYFP